MARQLRLEYPGAVYHVTSRGNARTPIFDDDEDRIAFLKQLHSAVSRFNWQCHAYCLMDNHFHLLIETPEANLSRGMRQLNGVYTQGFNRRHGRAGHLFQGRFKAIVVEKESYLLQLCRYIVRNPVAASMVGEPADWIWSSYRATAGLVPVPDCLTVDWILGQFGRNRADAQNHYREFVADGIGASSPWSALVGQIFLGAEGFAEKLDPLLTEQRLLAEIPRKQRYATRPPLANLLVAHQQGDWIEKDQIIYRAYAAYGYTQKEIADYLSVHYATVSRAVKRSELILLDCKT